MTLILSLAVLLLFIPAYLYTGIEIVELFGKYVIPWLGLDSDKTPVKVIKFTILFLWLPLALILVNLGIVGYVLYKWKDFYVNIKQTISYEWWRAKFGK